MDNYLLIKKTKELEDFGFENTFFLREDFVILESENKKELLKEIDKAKGKKIIFRAKSEEMLRFALEKTNADIFIGMENINPKDSVHFLRGGLDQIACKIAADKGKIIAFSFSDILNSSNRSKLLARMIFNIKLCKKYKVKILFSNFSENRMEIRYKKDLEAFFRVLSKS